MFRLYVCIGTLGIAFQIFHDLALSRSHILIRDMILLLSLVKLFSVFYCLNSLKVRLDFRPKPSQFEPFNFRETDLLMITRKFFTRLKVLNRKINKNSDCAEIQPSTDSDCAESKSCTVSSRSAQCTVSSRFTHDLTYRFFFQ